MKNHYAAGFFGVCMLISLAVTAQESVPVKQKIADKPLLFSRVAGKSECSSAALQKAFSFKQQDDVTLQFSDGFTFTGQVIEKVQRAGGLLSVNIRSANFPGALLTLSLVKQPDNTTKITGRIIHPQSGDVLVLTEENNRYFLVKQEQKFFMTE